MSTTYTTSHLWRQFLCSHCLDKSKSLTVISCFMLKVLLFLEQFGWHVGWNSCCLHTKRSSLNLLSLCSSFSGKYTYICVLFLKSITSLRPLFSDQPPKLYAGSTAGLSMPSAGNLTTTDNEPPNRFANSDVKYCRGQAASGWKLKHSPLSCICMLYRSLKYVEPLQRA